MDAVEQLRRVVARLNAGAYIPPLIRENRIMAKQVKLAKGREFKFSTGGGQVGKYPWDEWFASEKDKDGKLLHADGSGALLLLERDGKGPDGKVIKRDYDVETDAMPAKLKTAARRRYKVVQISRKDVDGKKLDNALIIRARNMDAAEREKEDAQRIIDRQKQKYRLLAQRAEENNTAAQDSPNDLDEGEQEEMVEVKSSVA